MDTRQCTVKFFELLDNNNQLRANVLEIRKFLKNNNNGIFITNRQVGKTIALLSLLQENKDTHLLVKFRDSVRRYTKIYKSLWTDDGYKRIITGITPTCNSYIDEYYFHDKLHKTFKGAVSTMATPITIKKLSIGSTPTQAETGMSTKQYNAEYLFNLKE